MFLQADIFFKSNQVLIVFIYFFVDLVPNGIPYKLYTAKSIRKYNDNTDLVWFGTIQKSLCSD